MLAAILCAVVLCTLKVRMTGSTSSKGCTISRIALYSLL